MTDDVRAKLDRRARATAEALLRRVKVCPDCAGGLLADLAKITFLDLSLAYAEGERDQMQLSILQSAARSEVLEAKLAARGIDRAALDRIERALDDGTDLFTDTGG
jgi:hypothetical protein